ncbi:FtsH protease activity modulator HflK [Sandaracinobacter sp. RS1-74]|uniref:FtsH protease activity modulator HflK n=1 Tax=Sandaracinobacteroides sayramensis TaxID=2913411 RepID=UPI001EDBD2F0|nr:FtsH protease activity modulator HflK [Sandaracinobacteroides sayramensis]MCG2839991.1 FtsH protease activity modulator HflK [Sandaracinobacteroides sayramensis]
MPWQNNEDGEESGRNGENGKRRNPWGMPGGSQGGGQGSGQGKEPSSGPRNPWGEPTGPRGGNEGRPRGNGAPDFDDFIRRSQERLRGLGGNQGGGGGRGGGRSAPNIPWGLIGGGLAVILLASTSAYQVGAGERGVVTRFGQYSSTSNPGFHLKLPAPIDQVTKVRFEDIRTTLIGTVDGENENLMITGDGNVISIAYAVRWRIKNAEDFLFQVADPEATVRDATESAMREIIGRSTLNNAIGPERAAIAEQVRERVQEILDSYRAGVLIQGVDINKADPPNAVDEAFKDVSAAQQDAQQFLNQARAYAQQIQAQAAGATAAFDKVYEEYRLAPEVTRKRMYLETMENVLGKVDTTVIETPGVQAYLPLPEIQRRNRAAQAEEAQR